MDEIREWRAPACCVQLGLHDAKTGQEIYRRQRVTADASAFMACTVGHANSTCHRVSYGDIQDNLLLRDSASF